MTDPKTKTTNYDHPTDNSYPIDVLMEPPTFLETTNKSSSPIRAHDQKTIFMDDLIEVELGKFINLSEFLKEIKK